METDRANTSVIGGAPMNVLPSKEAAKGSKSKLLAKVTAISALSKKEEVVTALPT